MVWKGLSTVKAKLDSKRRTQRFESPSSKEASPGDPLTIDCSGLYIHYDRSIQAMYAMAIEDVLWL